MLLMIKKRYLSITMLLLLTFFVNSQDDQTVSRVLVFKMISFNVKYEIYCTKEKTGYFRYFEIVGDAEYYFTYEGVEFYRQSLFDPDYYMYVSPVASNLWTNSKGEMMLFRKRFAPVTDRDKKALNFPYGYARN